MSDELMKWLEEPKAAWAEMTNSTNLDAYIHWLEQKSRDAAAALEAKDAEIERLAKRLDLLAVGFGVPDGGRYIADWQTRIDKFKAAESRAEQAERAHLDLTSYIEGWMSPGELKLHVGEMTAQEVRTVKAVLSAILDKARTART